ncbi:plant UBX domain-containing protein 4-like [Raphanus sativus]|uniref:Plant UBX domain-containing protein 4-like n=1 Tax=Raphanus sativus TaxID=3726 RepID=A0A9W3CH40_RAPSA|nr:plant UBX domain-containing protein 4-like [Raphanus sativus]
MYPSKKDDVDEIFNQARQLGAVEGPLETPSSSSSRSFTGTGRLLSGGESSIRKYECPKELEPEDRRAPVHVNLMRREEKCAEREKPKVSFQGVGIPHRWWLLIPHPFLYKPGSQQQQHHLRVLPGAPVNYQLQTTGFPPTPLADLAQTIQQAGLANSVVLQKF